MMREMIMWESTDLIREAEQHLELKKKPISNLVIDYNLTTTYSSGSELEKTL